MTVSEVTAYTAIVFTLIGLVSTTRMDAYVTPTIVTDYMQLPYKSHRTYLTNRMGSISHHITPLVTNSLEDGHTNTHTQIHMHTDIREQKQF